MNDWKHVIINKNRGWRGLTEIIILTEEYERKKRMIFSFSQAVWEDLIIHTKIVVDDEDNYYVVYLDETSKDRLPRADQQRSVLIKEYRANITKVNKYKKSEWADAPAEDWSAIGHFLKNTNNHTTSDWNCIGVRVIPEI